MIALMILRGKQHRPRFAAKWTRAMPLPNLDLFHDVPELAGLAKRKGAREWWLVQCKDIAEARAACLAWPMKLFRNGDIGDEVRVLGHGTAEAEYVSHH